MSFLQPYGIARIDKVNLCILCVVHAQAKTYGNLGLFINIGQDFDRALSSFNGITQLVFENLFEFFITEPAFESLSFT